MSTKTTTTAAATQPATRAEAQRRLGAIRNALGRADGLLVEAWKARDWLALGHATWKAYVTAELPDLQLLQVRGEPRDERIRELAGAGLSMGAVADALGVGKGTVHRALEGVDLEATTTSTDGRTMARRQAPVARKRRRAVPLTDRAVALLQQQGPLDVRQITKALGLSRTEVSPTLTRLVQAERIEYRAPERRGLFGTYAVADQ